MTTKMADMNVGDTLPPLALPPLTRHTLALYCGGSGDHNPLHTDIDFAKTAGLPDVIGHGMLSMAFLARALTGAFPPEQLRNFGVRFVSMAQIHDQITCTGTVDDRISVDGEDRLRLSLRANVGERELLVGTAEVAIPATT